VDPSIGGSRKLDVEPLLPKRKFGGGNTGSTDENGSNRGGKLAAVVEDVESE
jgi:hypothetical protein